MKKPTMRTALVSAASLFCASALAGTTYSVSTVVELTNALSSAVAEDEIVLAATTFEISSTLTIDKGITLRGVGAREATVLKANVKKIYVVQVQHADAVLKNVTITGSNVGYLEKGGLKLVGGLVTNVVISGNIASGTYAGPSAATISGGRLTGSLITGNKGGHAAPLAVYVNGTEANLLAGNGPIMDHCQIVGNSMSSSAASCQGTASLGIGIIHDCLIARNSCGKGDTAGVRISSYGCLYNCTIADNDSGDASAGGFFWANQSSARVVNCVIAGNLSSMKCDWAKTDATKDAYLPSVFLNCLFDGSDIGGTACKVASAADTFADFAGDDYSLSLGSAARDAGRATWNAINNKMALSVGDLDLADNERVLNDVVDLGAYEYDPTVMACDFKAVGKVVDFVGASFALTSILQSVSGTPTYAWQVTSGETVLTSDAANPTFTLNVVGRYDVALTVTAGEQVVSAERARYFFAAPREQTVSSEGLTLAEAVADAIDGSVIRVSGAVPVSETVAVSSAIAIEGVAGCAADSLVGSGTKCVIRLGNPNAVLRKVKVTGGGSIAQYELGCGIHINANGGIVEDCVVTGNTADEPYAQGVGVYVAPAATGAVIRRTIIRGNIGLKAYPGVGVYLSAGILESCLVDGNSGSDVCAGVSVGSADAHVRNCTIVNHVTTVDKALPCALYFRKEAVSSASPEVVNVVLYGNANGGRAVSWGAGDQNGQGDFITNNVIAAFAKCAFDADNILDGMDVRVVSDPGFDADGSYRLTKNSDLRDKGVWQSWMEGATDLYGNPRIDTRQKVDIGCCEADRVSGMCVILQ